MPAGIDLPWDCFPQDSCLLSQCMHAVGCVVGKVVVKWCWNGKQSGVVVGKVEGTCPKSPHVLYHPEMCKVVVVGFGGSERRGRRCSAGAEPWSHLK